MRRSPTISRAFWKTLNGVCTWVKRRRELLRTLTVSRRPCGAESNAAKLMAAEAGFEACDVALQTHGGYGYAKEFHVERLWREVRLYKIAPVSQQMVLNYLSEHVLGLPKSY